MTDKEAFNTWWENGVHVWDKPEFKKNKLTKIAWEEAIKSNNKDELLKILKTLQSMNKYIAEINGWLEEYCKPRKEVMKKRKNK